MWVRDPHRGGKKIPADAQRRTAQRIQRYAGQHHRDRFERLEVRFRGVFCYVDANVEPDSPSDDLLDVLGETRDEYVSRLRNTPLRLCRLRFFGDEEAWGMAYYTYSQEKYEDSFFATGAWFGTPEEAIETSAMFLQRSPLVGGRFVRPDGSASSTGDPPALDPDALKG
jgi:hypothetical protein